MAHNKKMQAAIDAYRAQREADPRSKWTAEQVQAANRKARLAQDARDAGSRRAATFASKARRGI